jgi:FtsP/CotA-like multicopper oxidase with cupredoxin domain
MSKYELNRREFLILSGTALAGSMIGVSCDDSHKMTELVQPKVIRSVGGILETTLDVGFAPNVISGQNGPVNVYTRTYNGSIPGYTYRVRAGDLMNIRLINNLPPNNDPQPVNVYMPHRINSTNLHTHGMHVSPLGQCR